MIRRSPLHRSAKRKRRIRSLRCQVKRCGRIARVTAVGPRFPNDPPSVILSGQLLAFCLTHAKREADRLFSLNVRSVGFCERCFKTTGLQCSHFISRRYLGTRWVRLNAECLCVGCHKYLTERPIEARDRARELLGATVYDELEERARRFVGPVDYAAIIASLRGSGRASASEGESRG